jgi:hypothetical protein
MLGEGPVEGVHVDVGEKWSKRSWSISPKNHGQPSQV